MGSERLEDALSSKSSGAQLALLYCLLPQSWHFFRKLSKGGLDTEG